MRLPRMPWKRPACLRGWPLPAVTHGREPAASRPCPQVRPAAGGVRGASYHSKNAGEPSPHACFVWGTAAERGVCTWRRCPVWVLARKAASCAASAGCSACTSISANCAVRPAAVTVQLMTATCLATSAEMSGLPARRTPGCCARGGRGGRTCMHVGVHFHLYHLMYAMNTLRP